MTRRTLITDMAVLLGCSMLFLLPMLIESREAIPGGSDIRLIFLPWMLFARDALAEGVIPLWNPYLFGGEPFVGNPQAALFFPLTWLAFVLPIKMALWLQMVAALWIGGAGMLIFVRELRHYADDPALAVSRRIGALMAACAFAFSGYMAARLSAGHLNIMYVMGISPWLAATASWALRVPSRRWLAAAALTGGLLALSLFAGHPTSLFYSGVIWAGALLHFGALNGRLGRAVMFGALSGLIGVLLGGVQLLPVLELVARGWSAPQEFTADGGYKWSLMLRELPTIFGPGEVDHEMRSYAGSITVLMVAASLIIRQRHARYIGVMAVIGLLMALGSNFFLYPLLFENVPGFETIRVPGRATVLYVFGGSATLGVMIARLPRFEWLPTLSPRWMLVLVLPTGVAVTAMAVGLPGVGRYIEYGLVIAAFMAALAGAILLFSQHRQLWVGVGVAALLVVELATYGMPLANTTFTEHGGTVLEELDIEEDTHLGALSWLPFTNWPAAYGIYSTQGHNPLQYRLYGSLFNASQNRQYRLMIMDLLSVEQVYFEEQLWQLDGIPQARIAYRVVQGWPGPLEVARMDPVRDVVVHETPPCDVSGGTGEAVLVERGINHWLIDVESTQPGILVVAETYYPGWRVWIDGERAEPLRVYRALRGVCIPAGGSRVEWRYQPASLMIGAGMSAVGLAAAGGVVWAARQP